MLVVIRGAGDLATGVAIRLHGAGANIVMTDVAVPTAVRRTVAFSEAIRLGEATVEDVCAYRCATADEARRVAEMGHVAVLVDPDGASIAELKPAAVVDAIIAKRNLGTNKDMDSQHRSAWQHWRLHHGACAASAGGWPLQTCCPHWGPGEAG